VQTLRDAPSERVVKNKVPAQASHDVMALFCLFAGSVRYLLACVFNAVHLCCVKAFHPFVLIMSQFRPCTKVGLPASATRHIHGHLWLPRAPEVWIYTIPRLEPLSIASLEADFVAAAVGAGL
jgi:hypothetical protein